MLDDAVLARSPVLSRLLRYLVEETVADRSHQLKSFVVAVDGLGRGENFDATSDSSARVQMVRLRKTLESYYAQHDPVDELCIYLQPGSYTVRMARLATAYPTLYRPSADAGGRATPAVALADLPPSAPPVTEESEQPPSPAQLPFYRRRPIVTASILAGIAGAIIALISWQLLGSSKTVAQSPILEIMPLNSSNPELAQTARLVSSTWVTHLPRFKLSRIRVLDKASAQEPSANPQNTYRLYSRLENSGGKGPALYLSLDDMRTETSLWSREVPLPADGEATFDALIPVMGEINGPMGVIASHGNNLYQDSNSGGYPCLLKYFEFVRTREPAIEKRVAACFEKPVTEQRLEATILAARAFFAIERREAAADFAAASKNALTFARAAVAADPTDGSANFALARMSYLTGDCVSARFYTDRTIETNPYSPMIMATLAGLANMCGYPDAAKLLDLAFLTQTPQFAKGRLLLTLGALGQDRPDKLAEIQASDLPSTRYNRVNYYLTETLIAAAQGRRADAARYWRLFSDTIPPGSRTPEEKLRGIVAIPAMRRKLIAFLTNGGAIGRGE